MKEKLDVFDESLKTLKYATKNGFTDGFMVHELRCGNCKSVVFVPLNTAKLMRNCPKCRLCQLKDSLEYRKMVISIVTTDL